jgi:hypothetical protein
MGRLADNLLGDRFQPGLWFVAFLHAFLTVRSSPEFAFGRSFIAFTHDSVFFVNFLK